MTYSFSDDEVEMIIQSKENLIDNLNKNIKTMLNNMLVFRKLLSDYKSIRKELAYQMLIAGYSYEEIGKRLGVSSTIARNLSVYKNKRSKRI